MDGQHPGRGFFSQVLIWDDHSWLIPRIKAAVSAGLPPLRVIFEDPDRAEWTVWDTRLVTALNIYDSMTNDLGVPYHWDKSDRVVFDTEVITSRSRAAYQKREKKLAESKSDNFGKSIIVVPRSVDGGPMPTLQEYSEERRLREEMMAGNIRISDSSKFSNANWKPES